MGGVMLSSEGVRQVTEVLLARAPKVRKTPATNACWKKTYRQSHGS